MEINNKNEFIKKMRNFNLKKIPMFGLFKKSCHEELNKVHLFERVVSPIPGVSKYSYRKKGKYEIIFDGKQFSDLTEPLAQAISNLLAHAWIIIWGDDKAGLHVGVTTKMEFRLYIDAAKLHTGHKFEDHDEKLNNLLETIGINRK